MPTLIFAGACGVLAAGSVLAQQAQPLPPGSPMIGRPDNEAAMKLAPVAPPPIPTAADKLPAAKLKVPKGFKLEVYASGVAAPPPRRLASPQEDWT
jgi:hypothetical protein